MEFVEVLDSLDTLWFFSNVLTTSTPPHTPTPLSPVSVLDYHSPSVHEKVLSWLQDSISPLRARAKEEEEEEGARERAEALKNAEQSTLIALVMSEPSLSRQEKLGDQVLNARSSDGGRRKGKSRSRLKSVKNELLERKRNVLAEIEYEYVLQLERRRILPELNQCYQTWARKPVKVGVF